jgi:hypothetical protein
LPDSGYFEAEGKDGAWNTFDLKLLDGIIADWCEKALNPATEM